MIIIYLQRESDQDHLRDGHLALSGLQVRGHAMFSHEELPLESETLEYAWLIDAVIGTISGKLSTPQVSGRCLVHIPKKKKKKKKILKIVLSWMLWPRGNVLSCFSVLFFLFFSSIS